MRARSFVRGVTRAGFVLAACAVAGLALMQYAHIIARNVAYAGQLHAVNRDIAALEAKRVKQQNEIARLSDPAGAIPEIHDRLHLVGERETIIYLKRHDAADTR